MLREINIEPVLNGFVLRVGCQRVVVKTPDELGAEIARYYKDPNGVEAQYIKSRVNNTMDCPTEPRPFCAAVPEPILTSAEAERPRDSVARAGR